MQTTHTCSIAPAPGRFEFELFNKVLLKRISITLGFFYIICKAELGNYFFFFFPAGTFGKLYE